MLRFSLLDHQLLAKGCSILCPAMRFYSLSQSVAMELFFSSKLSACRMGGSESCALCTMLIRFSLGGLGAQQPHSPWKCMATGVF